MKNTTKKNLTTAQEQELISTLKVRFEANNNRHKNIEWNKVQANLEGNTRKLWSLHQMESTGGEPDVVGYDEKSGEYLFSGLCSFLDSSASRS